MSNKTMPEKFWAGKVPVFIDQTNVETLCVTDDVSTAMQLKYVEYTRTNTIPTRAEVAREFVNNFNSRCYNRNTLGGCTITPTWHDCQEVISEILREWEDAESK